MGRESDARNTLAGETEVLPELQRLLGELD